MTDDRLAPQPSDSTDTPGRIVEVPGKGAVNLREGVPAETAGPASRPARNWTGRRLARILAFQAVLLEHGITATIRWSKGEDIGAACGQLREEVTA